jgi:hypothetical protein
LYSSSDIRVIKSGRIKWGGQVGHIREMRNVVKILVRKSERKRPLRIPWHRWEYNSKIDLRKMCFVVWIEVMWLRIGTDSKLLFTW